VAEPVKDRSDDVVDLLGAAEVTHQPELLAAAGKPGQAVGRVVDVERDDVGAVRGQPLDVGVSDSARGSGDHGGLSL
jgi:hypothetical protein